MKLSPVDWAVVAGYAVVAVVTGLVFARRAGRDVDEFFLSGRRLPWWIAGTSMVATTFAADTPLVITGWVRDYGIWKNWLWWCLAGGGLLTVFLFARYWRRAGVMTTAELAELRYGGREARVLRGFLGFYHSAVTNTIVLCWVLLAAAKIMDVLFGFEKWIAVGIACLLALSYALLSGFWGVVVTDLLQFTMAMVGAVALAGFSWSAIGGTAGLTEAASAGGAFGAETLSFFPAAGAGSPFASGASGFWTPAVAAVAVYVGVAWWAAEAVDGGGLVVQRIAATRDERHGVFAVLWYNFAHYALRPWPWILVALASLIVLPTIEVRAPQAGEVVSVEADAILIAASPDAGPLRVPIAVGDAQDWQPLPGVTAEQRVGAGEVIARTDSERAYVVMLARFLPVGLLGIAVASLLAAFMSTIDTHVNLAASYFVNDLYRRFLHRGASPAHYVAAARVATVLVLAVAGLLALESDSISNLFTFFLSFLAGVGPIYMLRWLWWRIRATTEITAMLASSVTATLLNQLDVDWHLGPLSPGGELVYAGRLCLIVLVSLTCSFAAIWLAPKPDPGRLVEFYRRVRPMGFWGPVRRLCPDVSVPSEGGHVLVGTLGGLAATFGAMGAVGFWFLGRDPLPLVAVTVLGGIAAVFSLRALTARDRA